MIKQLPDWCIANEYPAFYDTESMTVLDQTARLYGKVREMIDFTNDAVNYMKTNINVTTTDLVNQMLNEGQIKVNVLYNEQNESLTFVSGKEV